MNQYNKTIGGEHNSGVRESVGIGVGDKVRSDVGGEVESDDYE